MEDAMRTYINKTLQDNFKSICLNIHANLVEFGYDTLEVATVEEQVQLLLDGKETKDVIGMFAKNMLVENNLLANDE
tara:strand:+ start:205 stop:435 length:231 start_codon:yes stop_codon:yes gene_type:complete